MVLSNVELFWEVAGGLLLFFSDLGIFCVGTKLTVAAWSFGQIDIWTYNKRG
jgi:hypothetical protein